MHHMADVENKVAKLFTKQATRDFYDFAEIIDDYLAYIVVIRVCSVAKLVMQSM